MGHVRLLYFYLNILFFFFIRQEAKRPPVPLSSKSRLKKPGVKKKKGYKYTALH